ncbi:hypothetical protein HJFPF1_10021 [Paramyrothecium foliicola]|nr:hypothetical protein HJFPF1_10021 [Paramyrothecium foliicola]
MRHSTSLAILAAVSGAQAQFGRLQARYAGDECCPCSENTGDGKPDGADAAAETKTVYISDGIQLDTLPTLTVIVDHTVTKQGPTIYVTEPASTKTIFRDKVGAQPTGQANVDSEKHTDSSEDEDTTDDGQANDQHQTGTEQTDDQNSNNSKQNEEDRPNADGTRGGDNEVKKPAQSSRLGARPDDSAASAQEPNKKPSKTPAGNEATPTNSSNSKDDEKSSDDEDGHDIAQSNGDETKGNGKDNGDKDGGKDNGGKGNTTEDGNNGGNVTVDDDRDGDQQPAESARKPGNQGAQTGGTRTITLRPGPPVQTFTLDTGKVVTVTVESPDRARVTAAPQTKIVSVDQYHTVTKTVSGSDVEDDGDNIEINIINITTGVRICKTKSGKECSSSSAGSEADDDSGSGAAAAGSGADVAVVDAAVSSAKAAGGSAGAADATDSACKADEQPTSTKTVYNTVYATLTPRPRPTDADVASGSLASGISPSNSTGSSSAGLNSTAGAAPAWNGTTLPTNDGPRNGTSWNGTATAGVARPSTSGFLYARRPRSPIVRMW